MKEKRIRVGRPFTAREAAAVVECSSRYASEIFVCQSSKKSNGKSLMGIIALNPSVGDELTVQAKGRDEAEAADAVAECFR